MGLEQDSGQPTNERGVFLDEKQKELKGKIMQELLHALFGNIQENKEILTTQNVIDMVSSILIMFNRDVLVHTFLTLQLTHHRKEIMKTLFENIKDEVNTVIKKGMM